MPGQREEGAVGPGGLSVAIIKSWSSSFLGKLLRKEERVLLMLGQLIRNKVRAHRSGQVIPCSFLAACVLWDLVSFLA